MYYVELYGLTLQKNDNASVEEASNKTDLIRKRHVFLYSNDVIFLLNLLEKDISAG